MGRHLLPIHASSRQYRAFVVTLAAKSRKRKKIAVAAVARKLGVLLHRLWVTGEVYDPFYATRRNSVCNEQVA